jgi:hypothetical protein
MNTKRLQQLAGILKEPTEENYPKIRDEFRNELSKIKTWTTKPTLYKKFLQRLYTSIK